MRSEAWRPAAAACNRLPREAREVARRALRPGCEELAVTDPAQMPVREARPRVKNRHGGAERRERPASWDARRLARRLACRVMACRTGVPPSTRTTLGAPPTPRFGVSEAKDANPERKNAPRERTVLCEMWYRADLVVRWSCAGLTRASISFARNLYEEGWIAGSSLAMTVVSRLTRSVLCPLSATNGCTKSPPAQFHCFRIVIYNERRNCNVS